MKQLTPLIVTSSKLQKQEKLTSLLVFNKLEMARLPDWRPGRICRMLRCVQLVGGGGWLWIFPAFIGQPKAAAVGCCVDIWNSKQLIGQEYVVGGRGGRCRLGLGWREG